jgi:arylsulfatase A-like enzyme/Tfp pilus assembly protein PilF
MMPRLGRSPLAGLAAALVVLAGLAYFFLNRSGAPQPVQSTRTASPLPGGVQTPALPPFEGPRLAGSNLVVITVDTLRRDHLAPYGASFETAAASRLAREGVVFEHAVSQVPLTLPSHSTIFTGLYPPHHGVRDNGGFVLGQNVTTLAERLASAGYKTAGFVSSYVLHSRWGIAQGHETYDDLFDYSGIERQALTDVERPAAPVVDAALAWLRQPTRGRRPFYLWVHLYDPHFPYAPPEEFRSRAPSPYAGEVMYADSQVGRILDALDALDLRRKTAVAYLSDHGEALGEHGEPTHGIFLYGPSIDVPVILAPPPGSTLGSPALSLAGRRVKGVARLVDLTPTLLDLVGLPLPAGLDGVSLLPLVAHEASAASATGTADPADAIRGPVAYAETYYPRFHYNWSELTAVDTGRWKFVKAPRAELYDRAADPKETKDVTGEHPEIAATLSRHLDEMNLQEAGNAPAPATLSPDERARLQALGYVSGAESGTSRRTGPRADPKDGLPLLQELLLAQTDRDAGRLTEAVARLEALVQKDPENPAVYVTLSTVYDRMKDSENAIRAAKRAVALDPESVVSVLDLAFAFKGAGRLDEAATGFDRVLALEPGNLKALLNLGEIYDARGEHEKALATYQQAIAVAPRAARAHISAGSVALGLNKLAVAERALKQAVALGGKQPDLHFNLGVMAEAKGQKAAAMQEYRAEVAAYPDSLGAWVNLGLLERQAGRTDAALAAFEKAASARADALEGPYLMAETLAQLGRRPEAQRWAQEAQRRAPGDPRVQQLAQRLERR